MMVYVFYVVFLLLSVFAAPPPPPALFLTIYGMRFLDGRIYS